MKISRPISIRPVLVGESVAFLGQEDMQCLVTQDGLVDLISQLVSYKEEGKSLYPEIYIFDDISTIKKLLPGSQFCFIGKGDKTKQTMLKALKKCAPLTEGGWSIYILRQIDLFEFGVFKVGTSMLSVSISETLIDNGDDTVKAVLVHQIADRLIEVKGVKADTLLISFGSSSEQESPTENQHKFIEKILEKVPDRLKEATRNFYKKLFVEVLQKGHGTLACIIDEKKRKIPTKLSDGIILNSSIDVPSAIKDVLDKSDLIANSILEGQYSLILGMLQSDGITIFRNTGEVIGYNVFVKHPTKLIQTSTSGGARSRTFLTLCDMINSEITSAYIQSQDGKIEFK